MTRTYTGGAAGDGEAKGRAGVAAATSVLTRASPLKLKSETGHDAPTGGGINEAPRRTNFFDHGPDAAAANLHREYFACQQEINTATNLNKHITDMLEALAELADADGDHWRKYTFNRIANIIKGVDHALRTAAYFGIFCPSSALTSQGVTPQPRLTNATIPPHTHPHLRVHAGTESADELKGVQGIGAKSRAKIQEIIETGACGSVTFSFWFFFF